MHKSIYQHLSSGTSGRKHFRLKRTQYINNHWPTFPTTGEMAVKQILNFPQRIWTKNCALTHPSLSPSVRPSGLASDLQNRYVMVHSFPERLPGCMRCRARNSKQCCLIIRFIKRSRVPPSYEQCVTNVCMHHYVRNFLWMHVCI